MQPAQFLPWVVIVWLAGAMVFWVRLAGGWVVAARMRSMLVRRAPPEWQETLKKLGARIGLSRPVRLLVSALVQVPTVVGWLRPVVLVPVGALGGLPAEHLEALLLHELAHIRRHDYLINILQSVAESLLFYHPAVWWVSGHIRAERELCCDDVAVSVSGDVLTYARALAQLESYRPAHLSAAIAANGGSLAEPHRKASGPVTAGRPHRSWAGRYRRRGSAGGRGLWIVRPVRRAACDSRSHPSNATNLRSRLQWKAPWEPAIGPEAGLSRVMPRVTFLIQRAYGVQSFQVVGGPSWVSTDGYDIEAKPEGNTDQKRMWLMVQTLLADRFKLAMHRETRDLPVYDLLVVKGGPKLPPPRRACSDDPPLPQSGQPRPKPPCGPGIVASGTGRALDGIGVSMPAFAKLLSMLVGREVIDKTGVTARFALHVDFAPDDTLAGFPNPVGPEGSPPADGARPSLYVALPEQLGLRLQKSTGPVDVFVIDHVERPTEN